MQQETKIQCYQKAYQLVKDMEHVSDLQYPERKRNLEFTCNIQDIWVEYNLRLKTDLLTIRGTKKYPECTDSELTEIGQEILRDEKYMFTAYNQQIIFQLSIPMVGIAEEAAMNKLNAETERFFQFLLRIADAEVIQSAEPVKQSAVVNDEKFMTDAIDAMAENLGAAVPINSKEPEQLQAESYKAENHVNEKLMNEQSDVAQEAESTFAGIDNSEFEDEEEVPMVVKKNVSEPKNVRVEPEQLESRADTTYQQIPAKVEKQNVPDKSEASPQVSAQPVQPMQQASYKESEEEKENRLLQLEWIAEKAASNKRKEQELQERETQLSELEIEAAAKEKQLASQLKEADEKTAYWKELQEKCEHKEDELEQRENTVAEKMAAICKKESEINELEQSVKTKESELLQKESELAAKITSCAEKEQELLSVKSELDKDRSELSQRQDKLEQEISDFKANEPKLREENQSLKDRCLHLQNKLKENTSKLDTVIKENDKLKADAEEMSKIGWEKKEQEYQQVIDQLHSEKADMLQKIDSMAENYEDAQEKRDLFESMLQEANQAKAADAKLISKLQKEIELYKKSGTEMGTPDEILEDFNDTRKRNRSLEREVEDLKEELKNNGSKLEEQLQQVTEEKEVLLKEREQEKASQLPENIATAVLDDLKSNGIILNMEQVNGDICLIGKRDECDILVNVNRKVIVVKKQVFRANKHLAKLEEWNNGDITEMYSCDKRSVTCKKVMNDASLDVNKVLQKLNLIK